MRTNIQQYEDTYVAVSGHICSSMRTHIDRRRHDNFIFFVEFMQTRKTSVLREREVREKRERGRARARAREKERVRERERERERERVRK